MSITGFVYGALILVCGSFIGFVFGGVSGLIIGLIISALLAAAAIYGYGAKPQTPNSILARDPGEDSHQPTGDKSQLPMGFYEPYRK